MFNIGPLELMVLAVVGLVVLGPDRLPGFIRDARRLLVSLRDMATGARQQLKDELGPEFADIDLASLNPRTAMKKVVFGDDPPPDLSKYDPRKFDARTSANRFLYGDDKPAGEAGSSGAAVSMSKAPAVTNGASANGASANGHAANGASTNGASANGAPPRPRPRPRPAAPQAAPNRYDDMT